MNVGVKDQNHSTFISEPTDTDPFRPVTLFLKQQDDFVDKFVAAMTAAAAALPTDTKHYLITYEHDGKLLELTVKPSTRLLQKSPTDKSRPKPERSVNVFTRAEPEISQGEGLGEPLTRFEGRKRVSAYATPTKVEDWAGSVAGSTQLEQDHGVARSTLHNWQKQGLVIGLQTGARKHVFPLDQFLDGRPINGLASVLRVIGEPRVAWLWLREPNPALNGATPLSHLKAKEIAQVLDIARLNFAIR